MYKENFHSSNKAKKMLKIFLCVGIFTMLTSLSISQAVAVDAEKTKSNNMVDPKISPFIESAEKGDPASQYRIGRYYDDIKNYKEAADWYQKALAKNYTDAQVSLGYLYQNGYGVEKDEAKAVELYKKASDKGDAFAQMLLAYAYQDGHGVKKDYAKAGTLFEKSSAKGNVFAEVGLGYLYMRGWGEPLDFSQAFKCFRKARLAGNPTGSYFLGLMFRDGVGVEQNYFEAFKYFKEAALQNNSDALFALGKMQEDGTGTRQSYKEAVESFKKAAEQKNTGAFLVLGQLSEEGKIDHVDLSLAKEWYGKACDAGEEKGCSKYATLNKQLYLSVKPQDYRKRAEENDIAAQMALGHFYEVGQFVKQSDIEAKIWYGKACDAGEQEGCNRYAYINQRCSSH